MPPSHISNIMFPLEISVHIIVSVTMSNVASSTTGAALLENNEASAKLTTANGGTFTSSSARLSSQSRYSMLDQ